MANHAVDAEGHARGNGIETGSPLPQAPTGLRPKRLAGHAVSRGEDPAAGDQGAAAAVRDFPFGRSICLLMGESERPIDLDLPRSSALELRPLGVRGRTDRGRSGHRKQREVDPHRQAPRTDWTLYFPMNRTDLKMRVIVGDIGVALGVIPVTPIKRLFAMI